MVRYSEVTPYFLSFLLSRRHTSPVFAGCRQLKRKIELRRSVPVLFNVRFNHLLVLASGLYASLSRLSPRQGEANVPSVCYTVSSRVLASISGFVSPFAMAHVTHKPEIYTAYASSTQGNKIQNAELAPVTRYSWSAEIIFLVW